MTRSNAPTRRWFAFTVQRPVTLSMIALSAVVLGMLAYQRLPLNLMPELTYPTITIRTEYPAAAPEEVEDSISRPIEEALGVVHGLVRISSISRAEFSDVILEFEWDTDMDQAIQEVREKLDQIVLPEGVRPPLVLRYDPNTDPIMSVALYGDRPLTYLRFIAEEVVQPELEGVEGVAAVRVKGGLEEEIHVELHENLLTQVGISIDQVIQRLRQENVNLAGGKILEGQTEYLVRTINEFRTLDDIAQIIVGYQNGVPIYLKDIATVRSTHEERTIITRVNGQEAVILDIYREGDANIVDVARRVRERIFGGPAYFRWKARQEKLRKRLAELRARRQKEGRPQTPPSRGRHEGRRRGRDARMRMLMAQAPPKPIVERLPEGMAMTVLSDQSRFIRAAIREVRQAALGGGLIAIFVIYLFLRQWLNTFIVAVTIPLSVITTFLIMHLLGISLNIMSLGGIALGIGMLVDNAVVVLESIHRCLEEGDDLVHAVLRGTGEVGIAVTASTMTTVSVFFPMIFVEGVAGQLFGDQAATIVVSILASLVISLFLIPMLRSRRWGIAAGGETPRSLWAWLWPGGWRAFLQGIRAPRPKPALYLLKPLAFVVWIVHTVVLLIVRIVMVVIGVVLVIGMRIFRGVLYILGWVLRPLGRLTEHMLRGLLRVYDPMLRRALHRPGRVFVLVMVLVAVTIWIGRRIGTELIPEVHQGEFSVWVDFPVGTALQWTDRVVTELGAQILAMPEVERVLTTAGTDPGTIHLYRIEGDHTGRITVFLRKDRDLVRTERRVIARIRQLLTAYPQVRYTFRRPTLFSMRNPLEIEIRGDDLQVLRQLGEQVLARVRTIPEIQDVSLNMGTGFPEIQMRYRRDRLYQYGLDLLQVAEIVRNKVLGNPSTQLRRGEQRIDIRVLVRPGDRATVEDLINLNVNPRGTPPIPLHAVADIDVVQGPSEIRRIQQRRVALITAGLRGFDLGGAAEKVRRVLADIARPPGYEIVISGQSREMQTSLRSLELALALAVFLVYVVMASQFESLVMPFVIMFTIPLASVGVIWILWIGGFSLNVVVLIGMIILAGIVVNNAIVLLDYVQQLRQRGLDAEEAIVAAGKIRMRPILITTLTTVLALIPMAIGLGEGAELRQPMAWTIIAGLSVSTLLTLVIIPVVYGLVERLRVHFVHARTAADGGVPPAAP